MVELLKIAAGITWAFVILCFVLQVFRTIKIFKDEIVGSRLGSLGWLFGIAYIGGMLGLLFYVVSGLV